MLQQDSSEDYVIASGECHSVKEFAETAFASVDLDWKEYTKIDEKFYRPAEVFELKGDYSKAKKKLNWEPEVSFCDLVKDMVNHDLALLKKQISNVSVVR